MTDQYTRMLAVCFGVALLVGLLIIVMDLTGWATLWVSCPAGFLAGMAMRDICDEEDQP